MIRIRATISGMDTMIAANQAMLKALDRGDLIKLLAEKAKNLAKYYAPFKTGHLINRIEAKIINQYAFELSCDAENEKGEPYPKFLEEGTKHIKVGTPENPRQITSGGGKTAYLPFLKWAIWKAQQDIDKEVEKIFKNTYK